MQVACVHSCNDGAVSVLEELGAAGLAEVIVHRCDRAWWLNVEPEPEPELSQADTEAAQKVAGCKYTATIRARLCSV